MTFHKDLHGFDLHDAKARPGSGTPVGVLTPEVIGLIYFDTVTEIAWVSTGLTNLDWVPLGTVSSFLLREVVLGPFLEVVSAGTAINIQTGVYAGAFSPVASTGDLNVTLSVSGVAFKADARIDVFLNGQELPRGDGTGNGVAEWVSTTQIKLGIKIKPFGELTVRAPFPTA